MGDFRPRLGAGDARPARVGEEVEHPHLPARAADEGSHPVPIGGLFGEQPRVLEAHRLDLEGQVAVADRPFGGDGTPVLPGAAPALAAAVDGVYVFTGEQILPHGPDDLRIGGGAG